MNIEDFVRESNKIEGILREPLLEEIEAHKDLLNRSGILVTTLVRFVNVIQPNAKLRDRPGLNVRVGDHIAPAGGPNVVTSLEKLLRRRDLSAWERHCQYLNLHPFTDGNGRSARALWLWDRHGRAPLGFLHHFYYDTLSHQDRRLA